MRHSKVTIQTKRPAQYFRGEMKKGFFPMEQKVYWYVEALAVAGGCRKVPVSTPIHYKTDLRRQLIDKLQRFARNQGYLITFD